MIEQYKRNVSWNGLQQGILENSNPQPVVTPAGNAQLDQFVDQPGGLTGEKPPAVEEVVPEEIWNDPDFDEEDRISMMEEFPEISEPMMSEQEPQPNETESTESTGMIRLRILKDMPEPILDASGEEIELLAGDSFNCHALMAETLIAAGWAEAASLD